MTWYLSKMGRRSVKKLEDVISVTPLQEDKRQVKSIKCLLCGDMLYEFTGKDFTFGKSHPVLIRIKLHLELHHELVIHWKICNDKGCVVSHYL